MEERTIVFRGTLAGGAARPNAVNRRGRRCGKEGCTTVLSVYNPADVCWTHQAWDVGALRHRRAVA